MIIEVSKILVRAELRSPDYLLAAGATSWLGKMNAANHGSI